MTEIGEGISIDIVSDPNVDDLDDNHWLEVEYCYQSGDPVYGRYLATDSDGTCWGGTLNDLGMMCLAGLPAGDVEVELLPEDAVDDDEIIELRQQIQTVLDGIVQDQHEQAEQHRRELEEQGFVRRGYSHVQQFGQCAWNNAVGLFEFVGTTLSKAVELAYYFSPVNQMGNALSASFQSYQDGDLTRGQWYDSLNHNLTREQQKDVANLLGVDPDSVSQEGMRQLMAQVAEAYEIAVFIADDPDSREMLTQFAKDLVDAQSSIDWACFSGAGTFEIVLAALLAATTAGAGNIAHAASHLRHSARLRTLGEKFRKLAALLQGKKRNKTVTAPVDQRTSTSVDQPATISLTPREPLPNSAYHATTNSRATQGVLSGVDPKFLNPNSRFGAAFYVADSPATTLAELAHHGASPTHGIRFNFNSNQARILDLTNPDIARSWGYTGGPISSSTQQIGAAARDRGYNVIRYQSERDLGGVNNAVLDNFDDLLIPQFVSPANP